MAGKAATIFENVYTAVNQRRRGTTGALEMAVLKEVLEELGVTKAEWYAALARAKRVTPNLYELFYAAFGKEPRNKPAAEEAEMDEGGGVPEEEAPASTADILATVLAWLDKCDGDARKRVLAAVAAFYADSAA